MIRSFFIVTLFILSLHATNALIHSSSPYLLQHAENPIDWMAWDEKSVLEQAQREHKPILLSIGYSTCHWCHVMARESFENEAIANIINTYFIPVKIDREEHTHIDSHYQRLHRTLKGRSGGWPLHAILTEGGGVILDRDVCSATHGRGNRRDGYPHEAFGRRLPKRSS